MPDNELIPVERIQIRIVVLRGQRVLLDVGRRIKPPCPAP